MSSSTEIDIQQKFNLLKQESNYSQLAELIKNSFAINSTASNRKIFGYIPKIFRQVELNNPSELNGTHIFFDEPVIYKIYFPLGNKIANISYFYLLCYLKSNSYHLNVYFQSANHKSKLFAQENYTLDQEKIHFEGMISAFENEFSTICISDPGHFIPHLHSSYYAGSPEVNFAQLISEVVQNICHLANINLRDTFLFGTSAGGVGALLSSTYFREKVHVMSVNSQIYTYGIPEIMLNLFGTKEQDFLLQNYSSQVSCIHRFQQDIKSIPNLYLLANINDGIYCRNYELYQLYQQNFVSLGKNNQSIFDSYYGVEGHAQPDRALLKTKIKFARENLMMELNPSDSLKNQQIKEQQAEIEFEKANRLKAQGRIEQAIQSYKKAIAYQPEYRSIIEVVQFYRSLGNYDEAVKYCQYFIESKPKHSYINVWLGRILKEQGKIGEAIAAYQKAINLKPELAANVYLELGDLLLKKSNHPAKAIAVYLKALKNNPNWQPTSEYYLNLADALTKEKHFNRAIKCYQKVLNLSPEMTDVYRLLGDIYAQQGEDKKAQQCYQLA